MAGDWIPMRVDLAEDPAVIAIAGALGLSESAVVGLLHRIWSWANVQLATANAPGVSPAFVDRYLGVSGFASAMAAAGWLVIHDNDQRNSIEFVNFERWNSQSAKKRVLTARRVAKHTAKTNADTNATTNATTNAPSVRNALAKGEERREEKKEEKKEDSSEPSKATTTEPTAAVVLASPVLLFLPCTGSGAKEWPLTAERVKEWAEAYPGVDCLTEAKRARVWLIDNPTRRKTFQGMARFLGSWMARAQNDARAPASAAGFKSAAEKQREYAAATLIDAMGGRHGGEAGDSGDSEKIG